jgi:hypothetical protein
MDHQDRTRIIVGKVLAQEKGQGRSASIAGVGAPGRWIGNDARWLAAVMPGHLSGHLAGIGDPRDGDWALFQLFSFDQLRVTAHIRNEEIAVRLYLPGLWERSFFPVDLPMDAPTLPGGYSGAQFMAAGADATARRSL